MEGSFNFRKNAPHGDRKDGDVEVRVNGDSGTLINFRVGLTVIVNAIILLIGFAVATSLMKADVDALKLAAERNAALNSNITERLTRMEATMDYIRDDIRSLRNGNGDSNGNRNSNRRTQP